MKSFLYTTSAPNNLRLMSIAEQLSVVRYPLSVSNLTSPSPLILFHIYKYFFIVSHFGGRVANASASALKFFSRVANAWASVLQGFGRLVSTWANVPTLIDSLALSGQMCRRSAAALPCLGKCADTRRQPCPDRASLPALGFFTFYVFPIILIINLNYHHYEQKY
jgi:hypothetical protein